ncbi:TetR/AcrR family transcriptional regulator [Dictyobacter kobayashii]|uniref:TetR family transcriptional regulator n=1 Tax=Dictyobacter kobayashii TaxID=2014872 RepID=A0A402AU88_9CHLR|nr:TetR/AcrR family transcriptional regulator [Dictyobacter kobayashii]GCE22635.1 TetR family transcriptional regulator [Dictyobacter kobayashii]
MTRKRLTREESRQQTRERLLEAAAALFSRQGFDATAVDQIAEEAGFSKGAVYSNFASKEELFMVLLDRHLEAELQGMSMAAQIQSAGRSASEPAAAQQQTSFATLIEEKRTWNILTFEFLLYAMRHPSAQQLLAERYRVAREHLTRLLQNTTTVQGKQPALPVEYAAWALIGLGSGLMLQAYLEPGALPDGLYSAVVSRLLGGTQPEAVQDPSIVPD